VDKEKEAKVEVSETQREAKEMQIREERLELEKAQWLFRFEEEMLATLMAELKIMTSNERATVKTLNEFSEEAKRQTTKMRNSQREVVGCGGEV